MTSLVGNVNSSLPLSMTHLTKGLGKIRDLGDFLSQGGENLANGLLTLANNLVLIEAGSNMST